MQLADSLIDELLSIGSGGRYRKTHGPCISHQVGVLPRPFVKSLAVSRMTWRGGNRDRLGGCDREATQQAQNQPAGGTDRSRFHQIPLQYWPPPESRIAPPALWKRGYIHSFTRPCRESKIDSAGS